MDRARLAFLLLAPAAAIFAVRAALRLAGVELEHATGMGPATAAAGVMSLGGLALLVVANWRTPERNKTTVAATIILLGHFVLSPYLDRDLGAALVYMSTGFLASLRFPAAAYAGMAAGAGALLRSETGFMGDALIVLGSGATFLWLVLAGAGRGASPAGRARPRRPDKPRP